MKCGEPLPKEIIQKSLGLCLKIAQERAKQKGDKASFCGEETAWENCITWDKITDNQIDLIFWYNIGRFTHVIRCRVTIMGSSPHLTEDDIICQLLN